jgi:hypothetical protein
MGRARRKKATRSRVVAAAMASQKSGGLVSLRQRIVKHVSGKAFEIVKCITQGAQRGDLSAMKYLFEMIGLFPAGTDSETSPENETGLAKLVLEQLDRLTEPEAEEEELATPEPVSSNSVE